MMTDNNLISEAVFLVDAPRPSPAYGYDTCAHTTYLHTDLNGFGSVQYGFSIDNAGHGSYSSTADTTTWYAYDDVHYYGYRYYITNIAPSAKPSLPPARTPPISCTGSARNISVMNSEWVTGDGAGIRRAWRGLPIPIRLGKRED